MVNKTVLLLSAMKIERPSIFPSTNQLLFRHLDTTMSIYYYCCGIGPQKADSTLRKLITEVKPDLVILCGFCGSVNRAYTTGESIICVTTINEQCTIIDTESTLIKNLVIHSNLKTGTIQSFTSGVLSHEHVHHSAHVVDMEAASIVSVCKHYSIPSLIVKTVSDHVPKSKQPFFPYLRLFMRILLNYLNAKRNLDKTISSLLTTHLNKVI